MASGKKILKSEHGVTLTEVTLHSGHGPLAVAYVVQSKRTPHAPNFSDLASAEEEFREEVSRCIAAKE